MIANTLFDREKSMEAVLYIAQKIGGRKDMHKIFKTLYFADKAHLSRYGRSITGDSYIAMSYGPVPSRTDDIFKAVRGDSYFSNRAEELKGYFHFINKYVIEADKDADLDYLSDTDVECLDYAINKCKGKTFGELTEMSHDLAWNNTLRDREMSVKDILRENGENEDYVEYVASKLEVENTF
ncbi:MULTISPECIES: Panacea domain-containing protein [Paraprevotella]|uniref:Panacea domain-containing protein n=1 Tax=Paraprevotella TaxID=577309 RepID=UPI002665653D|nr:Panacea domain-containing protein [Paraprevotella xylaniphila]